MTPMNTHRLLIGALSLGSLVACTACAHTYDASQIEGTFECTTTWTWDRDGEAVPCSAVARGTCRDAKLTSTGVISLGEAQWDETYEGTCRVSGQELIGTRSSIQMAPKNDAARHFERDRLEGRSLGSTAKDGGQESRSRIVSMSETQFVVVNHENRTTTCKRIE